MRFGPILTASSEAMLYAVMAIGVYLTYRVLDFADLTVDGSFVMGGAFTAPLILAGWHPAMAMLISCLAGMAAGFVTGILHTTLKIPGILAGILTMFASYTVNIVFMGSGNVTLLNSNTVITFAENLFGLKREMSALVLGAIFSAVAILFLYWFFGTELGSAIRATGGNENMSRAQGINTNAMKIVCLVISNGLVAISGSLVAQNNKSADITTGAGTVVIGLACIVVGEAVFPAKKSFSLKLIGVVVGALVYKVAIAIVLELGYHIGLHTSYQKLLTALMIVIALAIPIIKEKLKLNKKLDAGQEGRR